MTEMQAAIGRIQLRRMADWTAARNRHARSIEAALQPFAGETGPIRLPGLHCAGCTQGCSNTVPGSGCVHAQYKYYAYVRPEHLALGWDRDRIVEAISARGVPAMQGSCSEVYREKAFDGTGWRPPQPLPVARELGETSLMLLVHPTLTQENMAKTVAALNDVLSEASARG